MTINMEAVYAPSEDIVSREIEGELVVVPLVAGIGDIEDVLYTANETGKAIWDLLDGKRTLNDVVAALAEDYQADPGELEGDVLGLVGELVNMRILVEVHPV